ncbi:MAG: DUF3108 domain-containing protein [Nitrospirota bacterium]
MNKKLFKKVTILAAILLVLILHNPLMGTTEDGRKKEISPFSDRERFVYNISWFGISAGTAILEIPEKIKIKDYLKARKIRYMDEKRYPYNKEVYRIISRAESSKLFSIFYPVDDRIETIIDSEELYPYYIDVRQREGKRKKDKKIIFNQDSHLAITIKGNKESKHDIPPMVQNSLSCLYYFRTVDDISVDDSVFIDVHENGKNWKLEIKMLGKEKVKTPFGYLDTIKTKVLLRFEGIFINKGDVYIWFTDDEYRIPVLMKTRIIIGSVTARLISKRP